MYVLFYSIVTRLHSFGIQFWELEHTLSYIRLFKPTMKFLFPCYKQRFWNYYFFFNFYQKYKMMQTESKCMIVCHLILAIHNVSMTKHTEIFSYGEHFSTTKSPLPAGQCGSSCLGTFVTLWKSSWHALQKWVVPKQKNTATEQQYRHLYSRKSVPCFGHICVKNNDKYASEQLS